MQSMPRLFRYRISASLFTGLSSTTSTTVWRHGRAHHGQRLALGVTQNVVMLSHGHLVKKFASALGPQTCNLVRLSSGL
jgi:hypothetical protein